MLNPSYNVFRDFIGVVRKEIGSVHGLIVQINSGMCPYIKRSITRIAQEGHFSTNVSRIILVIKDFFFKGPFLRDILLKKTLYIKEQL